MPAVGIEVTPEAVRFIEFLETRKGIAVGRYGSYPVPKEVASAEDFLASEELKKILSDIKTKHKLSLVHAAVPEDKTYIFRTEVPHLAAREIRESLELKLEENVPLPPREAVFDYKVIPGEQGDRLNVSVSVIPHLVVSRYLDLFTSVGLAPISFQVSAQTMVQALVPREDVTPLIVVNFGKEKTGLYLVSDRLVHFTSQMAAGGSALTEAIKKTFSITDSEAEQMKMEKGITRRKEDSELFFSLANTLSALKEEVEKVSMYWDTHLDRYSGVKQKIGRVILCGSESGIPGLPEYLEASLSVPVVLGNVWTNLFSFDSYIPPLSQKESLAYGSVIGLSPLLW